MNHDNQDQDRISRSARVAWQRIGSHQLNDLAGRAEIGRGIKVAHRLAEAHRRRFNGFQLAMRAWLEETLGVIKALDTLYSSLAGRARSRADVAVEQRSP